MKNGWQVVRDYSEIGEKASLTLPSTLLQAKNTKRRLEKIGVENLELIHTNDWRPPSVTSQKRKEIINKVYGLRLRKKRKK